MTAVVLIALALTIGAQVLTVVLLTPFGPTGTSEDPEARSGDPEGS
jgi:hypothetical protein